MTHQARPAIAIRRRALAVPARAAIVRDAAPDAWLGRHAGLPADGAARLAGATIAGHEDDRAPTRVASPGRS